MNGFLAGALAAITVALVLIAIFGGTASLLLVAVAIGLLAIFVFLQGRKKLDIGRSAQEDE